MPFAIALVRVNFRAGAQVGLHEHLEVLAAAAAERFAPLLDLSPHLVSEGNALGTGGLAHGAFVAQESTPVDVFPMKTVANHCK
jgi:hypothetical protein